MLQARLLGYTVINASIAGETSAGGAQRIGSLLAQHRPVVVVLELGANDGLRGLRPADIHSNLGMIIDRSAAAGARTLLLGMRLPPNYGSRYASAFEQVFAGVAAEKRISYVPFLLDGIGGHPEMMQADGLHPNESAQPILFDNVWRGLQPLVESATAPSGSKAIAPKTLTGRRR